jgi:outer membrane autotransporter protein
MLAAAPALAASHTISAGTVVYDSGTYGSDDIVVDGATATLQIGSGGLALSNSIDFRNGGTLDNSGTISRGGNHVNGASSASGGHLVNEAGGQIKSADYVGVVFFNGGTALNTGSGSLIDAAVYGIDIQGATGTVTNADGAHITSGSTSVILFAGGDVTNTGDGSYIENGVSILGPGGTFTNEDGAEIDGGVHMRGSAEVTNTGSGSTINGTTAVNLDNGGTVTNGAGASILGAETGVKWDVASDTNTADDALTVINDGTISGATGNGIEAGTGGTLTDGAVTITNNATGSISGDGFGVVTSGSTTLTNHGTISGDTQAGVSIGAGSITNSGSTASIAGGADDGFDGVFISADVGSVTNEDGASISGDVAGVELNYGGDVTNQSGATITGNTTGILTWGGGTIINSGEGSLISATTDPNAIGIDFVPYDDIAFSITNEAGANIVGGYAGVAFYGAGALTNTGAGSTITANSYAVYYDTDTIPGDVTNADHASINSIYGSGIALYGGGDVDNSGGATITGYVDGIYSFHTVAITNSGAGSTISGTTAQGIYTEGDDGTVTNEDGATISGTDGIWFNGTGSAVTNTGAGSTITGTAGTGITMSGDGSVTNEDGASIAGGVAVDGKLTLTNKEGSTITGGVTAQGVSTITNDGAGSSITGDGFTVFLDRGGSVTNTGGATISGGDIGVYLYDDGHHTHGTVTNGVGSTIAGTTGIHSLIDTDVSNAGTIDGNVWLLDSAENHVTLYSGSTITGSLYIGSNSASTLTLDGTGTQLYSDAVTDDTIFTSTLVKKGAGTWTIDKEVDAQWIEVDGGTLVVGYHGDGQVTGELNINAGATLSGSGRVYGNVILDHATIAPGNSPGTLTIVGGYSQDSATVYQAQIDPDNIASDLIDVQSSSPGAHDGVAIIDPGATIDIARTSADPFVVGTVYTVLSAEDGRTGQFTLTGDTHPSGFLALTDSYDANHAYLTVTQTRSLTDAALTPNQAAIAAALQSGAPDNAAFSIAVNAADDAGARTTLDGLSGELHASLKGALLTDAAAPRDAALGRLRQTPHHGAEVWGHAYGALGETHGDGNAAAIDNRSGGFLFGADLPLGNTGRLGVFGGSGQSVISGLGTAASNDLTLGAYGDASNGPLALRLGGAVTAHELATSRSITGHAGALTAKYDAVTLQLFGEAGYTIAAGPVALEPFAGLSYAALQTGAFDETVTAGVSGAASTSALALATLGLNASADFDAVHLGGKLAWQHAIGATATSADLDFGGTTATIAGVPVARDSMVTQLDIGLALSTQAQLTLSYAGTFASTGTAQSATGELRVSF